MVIARGAERLGLPRMRGLRRLAIGAAIDSLGSGIFVPFTIPYFLVVTDLGLVTIGAALSVAALAGVPAGMMAGPLVDRFGATAVVVGTNLLRALGFVGFLWVQTPWQLALVAALVHWSDGAWLPAQGALVVDLAGLDQQPRWFALIRSTRNAALGLGGIVAASVVGFGPAGYQALAVANAASYLLVAVLIGTWPRARAQAGRRAAAARPPAEGGYRQVLRDRPFTLLVLANGFFVVVIYAIVFLVPAYVLLTRPDLAWLPGVLYTVNTMIVVVAQPPVVRWTERRRETSVLRLAAVVWVVCFGVLAASAALAAGPALVLVFVGVVVFTAGELLFAPTSAVFAARLAPPALRGRYLGMNQLSWGLAMVVAPALFTGLLSLGPRWPWPVMIACCAAGWLLVGAADRRMTGVTSAPRAP